MAFFSGLWGRGRFSKRSASPPDPLIRRVAAVRVVFSSIQYTAASWSVVSCCLVVVAAALSAAVTTTKLIGDTPMLHGHTSSKERTSLFPATLRERGSGGEALLLEKRPLPQLALLISQTIRLRRGAGGWRLEGWGERLCQSRARSRRRGRDRGRQGAGKRCAARRRD